MGINGAVAPLLCLVAGVALSGWAKTGEARRDPFRPGTETPSPAAAPSPVKGMVADGQRRHLWTTDRHGRWRRREPPLEGEPAAGDGDPAPQTP
ncbi:hypothetical protein [Martelella alba]|uniref:Secreted protein n=1 Tax=Martelella alba TaxID=2590451 RepID=A0ABY2SI18_9HYPH|nr:hypothetical protein [Martelella alba]TKI05008.1 hypothetical protein FCN80_15890 [Martelella alba]